MWGCLVYWKKTINVVAKSMDMLYYQDEASKSMVPQSMDVLHYHDAVAKSMDALYSRTLPYKVGH